jgi:prepilin-type N-terminal cleavage/methylation domain-containing protein
VKKFGLNKPPFLKSGQRGFSLLESLIAMAIFAITIVVSSYQVETGKGLILDMQKRFTVDSMESFIIDALSQPDIIKASMIKMKKSSAIRKCFFGSSICHHRDSAQINMYMFGDKRPFTGTYKRMVNYDRSGKLCRAGKPCIGFAIATNIFTYCAGTKTCEKPAHIAIEYTIYSKRRKLGRKLRHGTVEQINDKSDAFKNIEISCRKGSFLRGIGMNGKAMCVSQDDLVYEDGKTAEIEIKPVDCRKLNKERSDQFFVKEITKKGSLVCSPKTW